MRSMPKPPLKAPPCTYTATGSSAPAAVPAGRYTLRLRQSSPSATSTLRPSLGQQAPKAVAASTRPLSLPPSRASGTGGRKRFSPLVLCAYGMPRNASTSRGSRMPGGISAPAYVPCASATVGRDDWPMAGGGAAVGLLLLVLLLLVLVLCAAAVGVLLLCACACACVLLLTLMLLLLCAGAPLAARWAPCGNGDGDDCWCCCWPANGGGGPRSSGSNTCGSDACQPSSTTTATADSERAGRSVRRKWRRRAIGAGPRWLGRGAGVLETRPGPKSRSSCLARHCRECE